MTWPSIRAIVYYELIYWRYFEWTTDSYVIIGSECLQTSFHRANCIESMSFCIKRNHKVIFKMTRIITTTTTTTNIRNVCNHYFKLIVFMREWLVSSRHRETFPSVLSLRFGDSVSALKWSFRSVYVAIWTTLKTNQCNRSLLFPFFSSLLMMLSFYRCVTCWLQSYITE